MNWSALPRRLRFFRECRRSNFASALAQLRTGTWPTNSQEQIACYHSGLFQTIAKKDWDGRSFQSGLAMAVSLASCGRITDAETIVRKLGKREGPSKHKIALADALAPLIPNLSLTLIKNIPETPLPLRIALLLRSDSTKLAVDQLRLVTATNKKQYPELSLLMTNALGGDPNEQIQRINDYLKTFQLPALALKNTDLPPSPTNLKLETKHPKKDGPLVTILMTAYNASNRIESAINGVLAQTWANVELVIVDDASTDDTFDVIKKLALKDHRIRTLRMLENVGTYVAKTAGIKLAKGEFVTCHDSDDWSHPLRIEKQIQPLINNPKLVATTSKWVRMEDNGRFYARPVHPLARLNPASPLFRRKIVEETMGLWDLVRTGADSEFNARLKLVFGRKAVKRLNLPLAFGSHRSDSLMTAPDTGYNSEGISPDRLNYWEAWTHWHIRELHAGQKPKMPPEGRPFSIPASLAVPTNKIDSSSDLLSTSDTAC